MATQVPEDMLEGSSILKAGLDGSIDSGLPPIDHTGTTDTATLLMDLSKEAIASDVYNFKRNATNLADTYRRAGNVAVVQGVVNVATGLINMGNSARDQYANANPGAEPLSAGELMGWYFKNDLF